MKSASIISISLLLVTLCLLAAAPEQSSAAAEAARLNNLGVAYMNQQSFAKALKAFQDAAARLNQGIALLSLGRVDEAKEFLEEAVKRDPADPHAWYNLGLLHKNTSNAQAAVDAFRRVTEIDPNDADTWYFLGSAYSLTRQYPQAIDAFQHAIKLNPLHASAEFGLSRAYQQSGDVAHAREHLQRFQYITQNKLGSPIGLAYGEQGKYSLAEESPAAMEKVASTIPVRFVAVNETAGLMAKATSRTDQDVAAFFGPGACFLDYDGDGKVDIFVSDNGKEGGIALYHNRGNGTFEDVTRQAGLDPSFHGIGCTAGDYDNDGATDLMVTATNRVMLLHNEKNGKFKDVAEAAGIKNEGLNISPTFIDYDHDGDLDLFIAQYSPQPYFDPRKKGIEQNSEVQVPELNRIWRNNGNGTFTDQTEVTGLSAPVPTLGAVGSDYNNDRAVDLLVTGWYKLPTLFENPREGRFNSRGALWSGPGVPTVGIAVLDFNHDGWMDVAFTQLGAPGLSLWRNQAAKKFESVPLPKINWVRGWGVAAIDYDNDGWIDLVAVGETAEGKGEVRLFRNLGPDGFRDVTPDVGLDKIVLKDPRSIITGDYDGDGAPDLLITQNHGPAVLLRNEGGNKNHWLRLALRGLNDNRSAIGTKVEGFAGTNRQKFEIAGSSGYLGQNSPFINVGLGQAKEADVVRMLWPTGVVQDEIEVAGMREQSYNEIDRRGSSCPTLFVWDGLRYELVSDMLGAGVVGHWVGPRQRNIPRPTEYVKIDRSTIREKNGKLSFRLMEPMEEVVYLDQVRLFAVDHPSDYEVYPNEYFASNPPYPPFKVVASRNPRPPAGAWDDHGHDVLADLQAQRYVGDFELLPFKGFTKPHSLELDLGEPYRGGPLRLLMHGEIEYFTATGMYAADQAGIQATAPYVEALDATGKWVRVIDDMGFPAGLPRITVAELSGKLPAGTQRICISTNLQIYWNNIFIDRTPQNAPQDVPHNAKTRLTAIPLESADLRFHGYPRQIEDRPPGNVKYVYEEVSRTGPYTRQSGTYTRHGDVRPLLTDFDDRFVVFGSGEEVALEFNPNSLPPLPLGWTRDFFFLANGYEKDMDFYAAQGNTVDPLPFRAMRTYPYPSKSYPLDNEHLNYLLQYNTRHVSGNEPRGYWYDFAMQK